MKSSYSALMQSKFFNPAFNSAIFDGPVRIYFSQFQESLALKIYFALEQQYLDLITTAKETHRHNGKNVLVMLYPNSDSFSMAFEGNGQFMITDQLDQDVVIAVNGAFEDDKLPQVVHAVTSVLIKWEGEHASQDIQI